MPWMIGDRLAEHACARARSCTASSNAPSARPSEIARVEAALGVEGGQQLAEAVFADHQVLQRQFAVVELDLVQVLAAHRVIGAGDREALGAASRPGRSRCPRGRACRRCG